MLMDRLSIVIGTYFARKRTMGTSTGVFFGGSDMFCRTNLSSQLVSTKQKIEGLDSISKREKADTDLTNSIGYISNRKCNRQRHLPSHRTISDASNW